MEGFVMSLDRKWLWLWLLIGILLTVAMLD